MNTVQYTIRGIPSDVDKMIRKRAKREGKSFNKTVVELLEGSVFMGKAAESSKDFFDRFCGSNTLDRKFDEAMDEFKKIDKDLWK